MTTRHARFWMAVVLALGLLGAGDVRGQALRVETGRLATLVAQLTGREYFIDESPRDERAYVDPAPVLHKFRHMAAALAWGDVESAARQAAKLDYEVVEFTDAETKREYYVLREDLQRCTPIRGWGSYIVNPQSQIDALVEVPHPVADVKTPEIGALVFEYAAAKGLLLAGAHRTKADVPDLVDSIFHQVHSAWIGPLARVAAWQIHGFDGGKHEFPRGAAVVASTGSGEVVPAVANLHALMEDRGLNSYVFNDQDADAQINKRLNRGVPGVTFSPLAATKNEQGRLSRSMGGEFVHVELEAAIRRDATSRDLAASVIAAAIARPSEALEASAAPQVLLTSLEKPAAAPTETKAPAPSAAAADDADPRAVEAESPEIVASKPGLPGAKPARGKRSRPRTS